MKITIEKDGRRRTFEVPDWARERRLDLMAGIERLATYTPFNDELRVKTSRCSMCGKCCERAGCRDMVERAGYPGKVFCGHDPDRPQSCSVAGARVLVE
nr:hypothetical protein 16 [bacterium]